MLGWTCWNTFPTEEKQNKFQRIVNLILMSSRGVSRVKCRNSAVHSVTAVRPSYLNEEQRQTRQRFYSSLTQTQLLVRLAVISCSFKGGATD